MMSSIAPRYNDLSRGIVLRSLRTAEKSIDAYLRKTLSSVPFVAGTTDAWTDPCGTSYCSLTVHFIDSSWSYSSHLLACSRLDGGHTGSKLSSFLVQACQKYKIMDKMVFISVANAANANMQVQLSAEEQQRLAEIRHFEEGVESDEANPDETMGTTSLMSAPPSSEESAHDDDKSDAQEDDFWKMSSDVMNDIEHATNEDSDMAKSRKRLFNRQPCTAHTLQLSVKKALASPLVRNAIASVRATCKFYRRSATGASYLREDQVGSGSVPLRPALDVKTRWGSTLFMLQRFFKLKEFISNATERLYREHFRFQKLRPGIPLTSVE